METLGSRLNELREEKNLTLEYVANRLGTTKVSIGRYEKDEREPKGEMLKALADFYDVTTDYLLCRTDIRKDQILIPDEPEIHLGEKARKHLMTVAAHLDDLDDEQIDEVNNFIGYLKSRKK
ncbi:helix-turn-helix domain-containing protein [Clostridium culturomicium]|uniref:helix-turn-helix domain-containing protein n=1 Tax=Clostridium culturomicium TaxID=1499683 RepID=UPI003857C273